MKSQNTFRPAILHPASLITLFTISLVLIGLVEYACRTLPSVDDPIFAPKQRRGSTDIQHIYTTTQDYSIFKTITVVETRLANQHRQFDSQPVVPAPESNLSLAPDLPITDYEGAIRETLTFTPCNSCPEFTAASSAYLRIETSTATTTPVPTFPTPADSAYLRIETATTIPVPISTAASSAYLRIETSTATTNTNATSPAPNSYLRKQNGHIGSTWDYIQGAYLPTLLSVMFTVPWVILSRVTASMEPFYCLASPSGAAAERALTVSMISPISPLLAIESGQWTRPLTVLLAVLSALITPLAPETIGIQTIGKCDHTTLGCTGRIRVFVPGARIIQALLAVMASSTIIVLILQRHKKWVSSSDPRSIAALAATLWGTGIRSNSKTLSAATHKNHMKQLLEGFRYKFVSETQNDGSTRVCLVSIQTGPQNSTRQDQKSQYPALHNESHIVPVIARRRFSSIAFLFLLIGLTAVILTYHYTSGDTGFENFMSGQGFGVQFLLTGVGVIISFYWRFVFQDIALLVPYSRLAKGNATARESVLLSPPSHPVLNIATAVSARHFVYFVITVVALLSEILPITLATIPFDSGTLYIAYVVSHWTSVGILAVMIIASIMLCFYVEPVLPIKPDSIASNIIYLADSTLSDTFAEICGSEDVSFDKRVEALGLRYALRPSRQFGGVVTVDVDDALQNAPRLQ